MDAQKVVLTTSYGLVEPDSLRSSELNDVAPGLREHIQKIVRHEAFRRAVDFPSQASVECDHARVIDIANTLARELRELPAIYNEEIVSAITYMAELMAPSDDDGLTLAISRAWVLAVTLDDYCETSPGRWTDVFNQVADPSSRTAMASYVQYTLQSVEPYSSRTFVNIWRQALLKAFLGGFLECRVSEAYPQGGCRSSAYLRQMSGYADFWGLTMSLLHPKLAFPEHAKVWVDVLSDINTFLCDYNDAMSVYKEAQAGDHFVKNVVFQEGLDQAFPRAVDRALAAADYILRVVPPSTRAIFHRFLHGYGIFHVRSKRYRMKDLLPSVEYYDLNIIAARYQANGRSSPPARAHADSLGTET